MIPAQRRAWLATWLQARRRSRGGSASFVTLLTGLAAYWKLDEAANSVRADSSMNGVDLYEFGPWTSGTPTVYQRTGMIGNAVLFDEATSWCLVSNTMPSFTAGDFSVSFWFLLTPGSYDGQAVVSVGATMFIGLRAYDDALNFGLTTNNGAGGSVVQTPDYSVWEGDWTHGVAVKSSDTIKLYLNGVESASAPLTGSVVAAGAGEFNGTDFIAGINPWGYPLLGGLDELGVWQRVLSAAEVVQLYNNGDGLAYEWF